MKKSLNKSSKKALLIPAIQHGVSVLWSRFVKQRNTSCSYYILTHTEEWLSKENVWTVGISVIVGITMTFKLHPVGRKSL